MIDSERERERERETEKETEKDPTWAEKKNILLGRAC